MFCFQRSFELVCRGFFRILRCLTIFQSYHDLEAESRYPISDIEVARLRNLNVVLNSFCADYNIDLNYVLKQMWENMLTLICEVLTYILQRNILFI